VISENIQVPIERVYASALFEWTKLVILLCTLLQDYNIRIGFCLLLFFSSDDFQNVSKSTDKYLHVFGAIAILIRRSTNRFARVQIRRTRITVCMRQTSKSLWLHFADGRDICNANFVYRQLDEIRFLPTSLSRVFTFYTVIGYLLFKHIIISNAH